MSNLGNDIANDRAAAAPRQATTKIAQAGTSPMIRPTVRGTAKEHSARGISMVALAPASEAVPAAFGRIDSAVSPNRTVPKPARVMDTPNQSVVPRRMLAAAPAKPTREISADIIASVRSCA